MTFMAMGGVFVVGGIAAKNLRRLKDGTFMKAFLDKGFFRRFMQKMPVHVVLEQKTALIGAAQLRRVAPGVSYRRTSRSSRLCKGTRRSAFSWRISLRVRW